MSRKPVAHRWADCARLACKAAIFWLMGDDSRGKLGGGKLISLIGLAAIQAAPAGGMRKGIDYALFFGRACQPDRCGLPICNKEKTMTDVYARLKELAITLPDVAVPAAAYVPYVQTGKLLFISGHIAKKDGKPWVGQLGKDVDTATGQQAARAIAVDLLGTLHAATGGDLNKVARIVKVMSLVNSTPDFTEQHLVTNGCSELLGQVFGAEKGAHARSAFGVAQIPLGACVEIELIAELV